MMDSTSSVPAQATHPASSNGGGLDVVERSQQTLRQPFERTGVAMHSGNTVQVRISPAPANTGRVFIRTDLPDTAPPIPATIIQVGQTTLSTELAAEQGDFSATVRTVEHLLAALTGMGVDNARIEIDGGEVPILDGSALLWVEAIAQAGVQTQTIPKGPAPPLEHPIAVYQDDTFATAIPSPELRFTYGIDFELEPIGKQWISWSPSEEPFEQAIAPARTFGLAHQVEYLRSQGLIKGGTLDNALVCGTKGWLNPPLRFSNEPVRHKLLDLVGDLSLVHRLPIAHYIAYKASHHLHTRLAHRLVQ
ncbi:MAG: UDP-3-O-acyl-N-acetylglucosamine deacetylase [Cyanobacteria bacterium J06638_20]